MPLGVAALQLHPHLDLRGNYSPCGGTGRIGTEPQKAPSPFSRPCHGATRNNHVEQTTGQPRRRTTRRSTTVVLPRAQFPPRTTQPLAAGGGADFPHRSGQRHSCSGISSMPFALGSRRSRFSRNRFMQLRATRLRQCNPGVKRNSQFFNNGKHCFDYMDYGYRRQRHSVLRDHGKLRKF